jgi:hypothetical protein
MYVVIFSVDGLTDRFTEENPVVAKMMKKQDPPGVNLTGLRTAAFETQLLSPSSARQAEHHR